MPHDHLIIATGGRHAYLGHDDWEPFTRLENHRRCRRHPDRPFYPPSSARRRHAGSAIAISPLWSSARVRPASSLPERSRNSRKSRWRIISAGSIRRWRASCSSRRDPGCSRHSGKIFKKSGAATPSIRCRDQNQCARFSLRRRGDRHREERAHCDEVCALWAAGVQASSAEQRLEVEPALFSLGWQYQWTTQW